GGERCAAGEIRCSFSDDELEFVALQREGRRQRGRRASRPAANSGQDAAGCDALQEPPSRRSVPRIGFVSVVHPFSPLQSACAEREPDHRTRVAIPREARGKREDQMTKTQCRTLSGTDVPRTTRNGGGCHGEAKVDASVNAAGTRGGATDCGASFACDAAALVKSSSAAHTA